MLILRLIANKKIQFIKGNNKKSSRNNQFVRPILTSKKKLMEEWTF